MRCRARCQNLGQDKCQPFNMLFNMRQHFCQIILMRSTFFGVKPPDTLQQASAACFGCIWRSRAGSSSHLRDTRNGAVESSHGAIEIASIPTVCRMVLKCFKQLFCHVDLTVTKLAQRVAMHPTVHVATPMRCAINALPFPAWHGTLSPSTMIEELSIEGSAKEWSHANS